MAAANFDYLCRAAGETIWRESFNLPNKPLEECCSGLTAIFREYFGLLAVDNERLQGELEMEREAHISALNRNAELWHGVAACPDFTSQLRTVAEAAAEKICDIVGWEYPSHGQRRIDAVLREKFEPIVSENERLRRRILELECELEAVEDGEF